MPANLNAQPTGLLGFLGIKNGGEYPQQLSAILQGTFDLAGLYEADSAIEAGQVTGNVAGGVILFGPAGATSTPGDTWHFHSVYIYVNASTAGARAGLNLGVRYANTQFVGLTDFAFAQVGVGSAQTGLVMRDFWVPPGASLAYNCFDLGAVPTFVAAWAATRYRY